MQIKPLSLEKDVKKYRCFELQCADWHISKNTVDIIEIKAIESKDALHQIYGCQQNTVYILISTKKRDF